MRALLRLSVLFCAVLLLTSLASAQSVQLLQNGDMETWTAGPTEPPDYWVEGTTDVEATQEGTIVRNGSYSMKNTITASSQRVVQDIQVMEDSVYTCSLWVYVPSPHVRVRQYWWWSPTGSAYGDYIYESPGWQLSTVQATAPTGTSGLQVQVRGYAVDWGDSVTVDSYYVDDAVCWGAEPPAINTPPVISQVYRDPYPNVYPTDFVTVNASITDNEGVIVDDSLYFQVDAGGYSPVYHDSIGTNGKYYFSIGTNPLGSFVEYYVIAYDDSSARSESSIYSYTVLNPTPTTIPIAEVQFNNTNQGTGDDCYPSDSLGVSVEINGIVTARYEDPTKRDRYFLQDADTVWSGVYVFNGYSGDTVQVGDDVTVVATVDEYYGLTEMGSITTQTINSSGNSLPAPIIITCADLGSAGCAANPEAYEGVYIQINNAVVTSDGGSGEFWINDGSGDSCLIYDEVYINGDDPPSIAVGDFCEFVRGVGTYAWSNYKISPRFSADVSILDITPIAIIQFNNSIPGGTPPDTCYPSPWVDSSVVINGLVTAVYQRSSGYNDFYIQDADTAWSGVYVYNSADTAEVGDNVTIGASVAEYYGLTEIVSATTHITNSTGNTLPDPLIITCSDLGSTGCGADPEAYEGVLIQINDAIVTSDAGNGEFWINDGTGDSCLTYDEIYRFGTDIPPIAVGDTCSFIRGVGNYSYGDFKIAPRFSADYQVGGTPQCSGYSVFDIEFSVSPTGPDTADCWPSQYNQSYQTFCGVVTAVTQGQYPSFYMQDPDNTAWGGIYVYDFTTDTDTLEAALGDYVELNGYIKEYYGWTEVDSLQSFSTLATNQDLPDTAVITVADLIAGCDYTTEPYENILVRLNNVTVLSDLGFGELWITDASTTDSIRIDSDLWYYGSDQPDPLPATGATYDWIIGVVKWQGRNDSGRIPGFIVMPRFGSDYESLIIPEPEVLYVWSIDYNTLGVRFNHIMDPTSAEVPGNYTNTGGLTITAADIDADSTMVTLTTSLQTDDTPNTLIVNGVCDTSGICMTTPDSTIFHEGITPLSTVQTPGVDGDTSQLYEHVVTLKAVVVNDSTMTYPANLYLNDGSGPPYNGILTYFSSSYSGPWPELGDTLVITGRVLEYYNSTELSDFSDFNNATMVGNGGAPVPAEVTAAELYNSLSPAELLEGVLVTVCDTLEVLTTVGEFDAFGFLVRNFASPPDTFVVHHEPGSAGHTRYSYTPVVGDTIAGITGVFRYRREAYRLMPRGDFDFNTYDTYCGASGCDYVVGDANGSGGYNGLDITYGVNFFKYGSPEPVCPYGSCPIVPCDAFFYCGDVNGSCNYNGLDITYGVNYFKFGSPAPEPCGDCPPSGDATEFEDLKPKNPSIDKEKTATVKTSNIN